MTPPTAATFLNLDLEVDATCDLGPLAKHLEGRVFVLFSGLADSGFRLTLEPLIKGKLNDDPIACTEHFLGVLETLPQNLVEIWASCTSRVFDYGFDGGLESPPVHMDVPASMLARAAELKIDFRITIYPFRGSTVDEA